MQRSALCRSRRELSNAYFLAKFGFDTAENEPCKVCPISVNTEAGGAESVAARVNERAAARRDLQLHAEDPEVLGRRAEKMTWAAYFKICNSRWGSFFKAFN